VAMARAKMLPDAFQKVHKKHKTPHVAIIFTVIVSMFAPWFGREALLWVVDMSSIGVSIAYFYTCFTAFTLYKWSRGKHFNPDKHVVSPVKKVIAGLGALAGLTFIGLLLIPGSPAFLGIESRIALIAWIILGLIFYMIRRAEFSKIPRKKMNHLILGEKEIVMKNKS